MTDQTDLTKLTGRERSLANLKPFSSTHQPANRRSRKGIPNRATILKLYFKEAEKLERRRQRRAVSRREMTESYQKVTRKL
jgi:hypothetical protein